MSADRRGGAGAAEGLTRLAAILARLRAPDGGCPWDQAQTFETIAPYTIEEAYEVADAIERGDWTDLCDELGDLLIQVVYHARMAEEAGRFTLADAVYAAVDKMVRRHPHVFAGAKDFDWEAIKATERAAKARLRGDERDAADPPSHLADVPRALPALVRAAKLQKRAAGIGFDWPDATDLLAKLLEEAAELTQAISTPARDPAHVEEEMGDLLFTAVNLARRLEVEPEAALARANAKFTRRFQAMERALADDRRRLDSSVSLEEMDALWNAAKRRERRDGEAMG